MPLELLSQSSASAGDDPIDGRRGNRVKGEAGLTLRGGLKTVWGYVEWERVSPRRRQQIPPTTQSQINRCLREQPQK